MSACAVCKEMLDTTVLRKKRKRLYGPRCRDGRQVLERVLHETTPRVFYYSRRTHYSATAVILHFCTFRA